MIFPFNFCNLIIIFFGERQYLYSILLVFWQYISIVTVNVLQNYELRIFTLINLADAFVQSDFQMGNTLSDSS